MSFYFHSFIFLIKLDVARYRGGGYALLALCVAQGAFTSKIVFRAAEDHPAAENGSLYSSLKITCDLGACVTNNVLIMQSWQWPFIHDVSDFDFSHIFCLSSV